jgi:hypothetical protein
MKEPMNTGVIKSMDKIPVTKNTVPFEAEAPKKLNYYNSDVMLVDLAELADMNPINISDNEKQMTAIFLDKLLVNFESKVVIDITTTPHELACFFLTAIRSISRN